MSCSRSRAGFTLIEVLVVIAIISILAAVVAPAVFGNVGRARGSATRTQLQVLSLALDAYRLDNFDYPLTSDGLAALVKAPTNVETRGTWRGPYLRGLVPADPWGRPYIYISPGKANPTSFDLYTLGRDGVVGGQGEDEDLTSWNGPARP